MLRKSKQDKIESVMKDANIESVGVASGNAADKISTTSFGDGTASETVFGAASLSKPVFAYLVLKLIEKNYFSLSTKLNDHYPFSQFCKEHNIEWQETDKNKSNVVLFTPDLILSHRTGVPIGYREGSGPLQFDFATSENKFSYSGIPFMYLQKYIESLFDPKKSLQELAHEYVFEPAKMSKQTTFAPNNNAANSLQTTTTDYIKFCLHVMNDEKVKLMFENKISMTRDPWAIADGVSSETLQTLHFGYGWMLEKDKNGNIIASHTGDMSESRSGVQLDLTNKSATCFFSKSLHGNGHLLQESVFGSSQTLDYFFQKYHFAKAIEELPDNWRDHKSWGITRFWPDAWQMELISQVMDTAKNYYCLPEKFEIESRELRLNLINTFIDMNETILRDTRPNKPTTDLFLKCIDRVNDVLHQFDSQLGVELKNANNELIPTVTHSSKKLSTEKETELSTTALLSKSFGLPIATDNADYDINLKSELKNLFEEDEKERSALWSLFSKDKPAFEAANQQLSRHDEERRHTVDAIMNQLTNPSKEDYYHAAIIFQHGEKIEDYQKANMYAAKSHELGAYQPADPNMCDNKYLVATTYDRLQCSLGLPQKYGTQSWAPNHPDPEKRDMLVHPNTNQAPDINAIEEARKELGIKSLKDERAEKGLPMLLHNNEELDAPRGTKSNTLS